MFPLPSAIWLKVGVVVLTFISGYGIGWSGQHKKLVAFKAEVAAAGKAQEVVNAAKIKEHETISTSIKDEYEARLAAVHHYYANRVQSDTGSSNVPTVSKPTVCPNVCAPDTGLIRRCAETTLQLTELQKWVRSVK